MSKCSKFKSEVRAFRNQLPISHVLLFTAGVYVCMFPLRRLSHYNHKTLVEYWPDSYQATASSAMITFYNATSSRRESLNLHSYLEHLAPHHSLDLKRVVIKKENVLRNCHGCLTDPLRLWDLGHMLTRDWMLTKNSALPEYCMLTSIVFCFLFSLIPMFFDPPADKPKVRSVNMWVRVLRAAFVLHCIRPMFHLVTALPGTPMHCQSSVVLGGGGDGKNMPHICPRGDSLGAFLALLFSVKGGKSCGDLIYSGHMITAFLMVFFMFYYSPKILPLYMSLLSIAVAIILCVTQAILIISARNHYTLDIVLSFIMVASYYLLDADTSVETFFNHTLRKLPHTAGSLPDCSSHMRAASAIAVDRKPWNGQKDNSDRQGRCIV